MGSVAPGTQCKDGEIVLAAVQRMIRVRNGMVLDTPLRGGKIPARGMAAIPGPEESSIVGSEDATTMSRRSRRTRRSQVVHEMRRHS